MTLSPLKGPLTCKGTHTTCTELTNAFPDAVSVLLEDCGFYDSRHRSAIIFNEDDKVIAVIRAAYKNEVGEIVIPSFRELHNVPRYNVGDVVFMDTILQDGKKCVVESRVERVYRYPDKACYVLSGCNASHDEKYLFRHYSHAVDHSHIGRPWPIFAKLKLTRV